MYSKHADGQSKIARTTRAENLEGIPEEVMLNGEAAGQSPTDNSRHSSPVNIVEDGTKYCISCHNVADGAHSCWVSITTL